MQNETDHDICYAWKKDHWIYPTIWELFEQKKKNPIFYFNKIFI